MLTNIKAICLTMLLCYVHRSQMHEQQRSMVKRMALYLLTPINNSQNLRVSRIKWPMEIHQTIFRRHQTKMEKSRLGTRLLISC